MEVKISLPLLPLRDIVVFPSMVIPLFVGRDKSISALNEVMKKDKKIILVTQKNSEIDDPKKTDVFMYGCEGSILQLLIKILFLIDTSEFSFAYSETSKPKTLILLFKFSIS